MQDGRSIRAEEFFRGRYSPFRDYAEHYDMYLRELPRSLLQMRRDTARICGDFDRFADRVFCSPSNVLGAVLPVVESHVGGGEELCDWVAGYRHGFLMGLWALDKTAAVFDAQQAAVYAGTQADWWRDYPTDWVLERFLPWSVFLSEPDEACGTHGYFVGFELFEDAPALYCQSLGRDNDFNPFLYHEFVFSNGLSLGEVAECYVFENAASRDMLRLYAELCPELDASSARRLLSEEGRRIVRRILPLLTAFLSEDFSRQSFRLDDFFCAVKSSVSGLRARTSRGLIVRNMERIISSSSGELFCVALPEPKRRAN